VTGASVTVDAEVDGCPVAAGQQRLREFAAVNRDSAVFTDPEAAATQCAA
jgi:cytochrome P450